MKGFLRKGASAGGRLLRIFSELRRPSAPVETQLETSVPETVAAASPSNLLNDAEYEARIAREVAIFEKQEVVHDLPEIYHYWSNTHLRPRLEPFGFSNPDQFFALFLQRCIDEKPGRALRFASLGCGNCDTEVRVAKLLVERGVTRFNIECVDINITMLERGREMASAEGVAAQITPSVGDFNHWRPHGEYDAIMANQSLHHVVELEDLFESIERSLAPLGRFIAADMIGRNGHQLWPEALFIVHEYWCELPPEKTWNRQLQRFEPLYENWDCSLEGFEGIRAQDILPLLVQRFDFEFFYGFAGIIDPFIGRGFGAHLDAQNIDDRAFVDRIHARDEAEMLAGTIKPTHLMAVMRKRPFETLTAWSHMTPQFCVRQPD